MLPQAASFHSFLASNIPLRVCVCVCACVCVCVCACVHTWHLPCHSAVSGHLGAFGSWLFVGSVAMRVGEQVSFQITVFSGYMPKSGIARS